MRIADNISAIKRALDKITGAARSGTRFSALEPDEQPKNMGSSHDFNLMTGGCNICQCSWEEIQDGLVSRDTCDGPVDVPRRFWVSKLGITEYWVRRDGERFHRVRAHPGLPEGAVVTSDAEFKAWLRGEPSPPMREPLFKVTPSMGCHHANDPATNRCRNCNTPMTQWSNALEHIRPFSWSEVSDYTKWG